jgi:hypothetical protein
MNKKIIKISGILLALFLAIFACKEETYSLGDLTAPSNLQITTSIVGQSTSSPNGDGSGVVKITATGHNALTYKIGYTVVSDVNATPTLDLMPNTVDGASVTKTFATPGEITYRVTVVAYGRGGSSSVATKDITVKSVYNVDPTIVTDLTNNSSKTWVVDAATAGHFGVGPYKSTSYTPEYYSAGPYDKAKCCNCFYTASFKFTVVAKNTYTMSSITPDGAFTKTGTLAGITGIPASGDEGCYPYAGGTTAFFFSASSSGVVNTPGATTTNASILLDGNTTFIGYGATKKEYEILEITPNYMYLRVQGTEPANAWYIRLIPKP